MMLLTPRTRSLPRPAPLLAAALALLLAGACRSATPGGGGGRGAAVPDVRPPESARELVQRMNARWAGRWYRTLSYTQENVVTSGSAGESRSTWLVQQAVPGRLRQDFLPASGRGGVLFVDNVQRTYTDGRLTDTRPLVNALVLLGADVYATPPARTMRLLDSLRIDTTKFYATRGVRQMFVVGAEPGDTASNQFWVDGDSLLLRRLVQRSSTARGRTTVSDMRVTYQAVDGVPVPQEIVFRRNGAPYWRQTFTQVRVNSTLPPELFDPERWSSAARP